MALEEASVAPALPPAGEYRYELRRAGELIAVEEETLARERLRGARRTPDGLNRHEVDARLAEASGLIVAVAVRYRRGPFSRSADYETADDIIRGHLSAVGGRESVSAKLGRMREVDADLVVCKALIIARARARGQARWIGRVATIDPATLIVNSYKQTYRRRDEAGRRWIFEPRMGDADEIEIDDAGRVVRYRARDGVETVLVSFAPERAR
ncbi:MAG TPA: hypothetical protein VFB33_01075 [Candidatus Binataceae bacterium]|nr:hypothetical protein [Candidatus Binataceae bacterium]